MTEDQLEQKVLCNSRFSIHVSLDMYKNADFLYATSAVSE